MSKDLMVISNVPSLTKPAEGLENAQVGLIAEHIMDHWREFTSIQTGIASRLVTLKNPAESVTKRMKWHLEQALEIIKESKE